MAIESGRERGNWTFRIFGVRFGFEYSPIIHAGNPYMFRWLLYVFGYTVRLHHIMRADLARDLHNHPFWFITIPFGTYVETYWYPYWDEREGDGSETMECRGEIRTRTVRRFVPQFRGIKFRHRIIDLPNGPVWTFVISGRYQQKWGFFPQPDVFIPWSRTERNTEEPTE